MPSHEKSHGSQESSVTKARLARCLLEKLLGALAQQWLYELYELFVGIAGQWTKISCTQLSPGNLQMNA